jgi:hypothetical protein
VYEVSICLTCSSYIEVTYGASDALSCDGGGGRSEGDADDGDGGGDGLGVHVGIGLKVDQLDCLSAIDGT